MSGAYGMPTSGSMSGGYAAREQAPCDGLLGGDGTCYSYCGKYKTGIDIGGTCKGKTCAGMWSANNCNAIAQIVGCTWSGSLCQDSGCHGAPASGSMSGAYGMPTSGSMSGGYAAPPSGSMSGGYGAPARGSMSGGYVMRDGGSSMPSGGGDGGSSMSSGGGGQCSDIPLVCQPQCLSLCQQGTCTSQADAHKPACQVCATCMSSLGYGDGDGDGD